MQIECYFEPLDASSFRIILHSPILLIFHILAVKLTKSAAGHLSPPMPTPISRNSFKPWTLTSLPGIDVIGSFTEDQIDRVRSIRGPLSSQLPVQNMWILTVIDRFAAVSRTLEDLSSMIPSQRCATVKQCKHERALKHCCATATCNWTKEEVLRCCAYILPIVYTVYRPLPVVTVPVCFSVFHRFSKCCLKSHPLCLGNKQSFSLHYTTLIAEQQ